MKTPVVIRDEYTIFFEAVGEVVFVHCDVMRWTHETAKEMKQVMRELRALHGRSLYAVNEPHGCKKHQRFMRLMGFVYHCDLPTKAGGVVHVFKV